MSHIKLRSNQLCTVVYQSLCKSKSGEKLHELQSDESTGWKLSIYTNKKNFKVRHQSIKFAIQPTEEKNVNEGNFKLNYLVVWTAQKTNKSSLLLQFNFVFILEEVPRIGGFICFLKTLTKLKAGSEILPHSPKEEFHPVIKKIW